MRWIAVLDRFIPKEILESKEAVTKARILVGILEVNTLISVYALLSLVFLSGQSIIDTNSVFFTSIPTLSYVLCLWLFIKFQSIALTAKVFSISIYGSIVIASIFTGGYGVSPSLVLLVIVPVYLFMLAGRRDGILMSVLVFLTFTAFFIAQRMGIEFPQVMSTERNLVVEYIVWVVMFFAIFVSFIVYEVMNSVLRISLDTERNKLAHQATHDLLTGLANRRLFYERLNEAVARCKRNGELSALLYIDIDKFKPINDQYGHSAGDIVLQELSRGLKQSVRQTDTVARLGGDEFAVIAEQASTKEDILVVVQKLRDILSAPISVDGNIFSVNVSIGVVTISGDSDPDTVCHHADAAMYNAKVIRNTYCIHEGDQAAKEKVVDTLNS